MQLADFHSSNLEKASKTFTDALNPMSKVFAWMALIPGKFDLLSFLILIILNLLVYSPTFFGYFLADDFVHVAYLADVFNGHPQKLLENFRSNWMQAWGTQFYRPLVSLTLALDYMLGNGDALPFHVTNTIYHFLAAFFLYLASKRLLHCFPEYPARISALFAGIFFTLSPLHGEVVSWIIGRVDGLCLALFMPAFYFFLRSVQEKSLLARVLGLILFALALLAKEMALTLPPLLVLSVFLQAGSKLGWKEKCKLCWKETLPYFLVLAVYFCLRTWALGTPVGGYTGSLGEGLSASLLTRFQSLAKIVFPFNGELFGPFDRLQKQLAAIYRCLSVFLLLRFTFFKCSKEELKLLVFTAAWFLLSLAPTYQVFNITDSLMCSRFAYFATAAFSFLLALLLSPIAFREARFKFLQRTAAFFQAASVLLLLSVSLTYLQISKKNNGVWLEAGNQVRKFRQSLALKVKELEPDSKLVLLNSPQRFKGAHMIYNGAMLSVLLSEPLSNPPLDSSLASFEAATYGDADLISASRLRRLLAEKACGKRKHKFVYWDQEKQFLSELNLSDSNSNALFFDLSKFPETLARAGANEKLSIETPPLSLNAAAIDFARLKLKLARNNSQNEKQASQYARIYWSSSAHPSFQISRSVAAQLIFDGEEHDYYFPLSEHKSWFAESPIERLKLELPENIEASSIKLGKLELIRADELMPKLNPRLSGLAEGQDGIFRPSTERFELEADASLMPEAKSLVLELSKANSWFEHYAGTYRERELSKEALLRKTIPSKTAVFLLDCKSFPQQAYYETRIFALNAQGKIIGFCSDPICLQIDRIAKQKQEGE